MRGERVLKGRGRARMRGARRKGFTLMESIVAIAVFAIAAVMFATILFTSTRMVNLSLRYDRDREILMEVIESDSRTRDDITVEVYNSDTEQYEFITLKLSSSNVSLSLEKDDNGGEYILYAINENGKIGRRFCIYL